MVLFYYVEQPQAFIYVSFVTLAENDLRAARMRSRSGIEAGAALFPTTRMTHCTFITNK